MLFFDLLVVLLVLVLPLILGAEGSLQRRKQSRSVNCSSGSGEQSCQCRACEHSLRGFRHCQILLSILRTSPRNTVTTTCTVLIANLAIRFHQTIAISVVLNALFQCSCAK